MTVFLDISAALDTQLNTMTGVPDIAWENRNFTPTIGELFVRPTLLPSKTIGAAIGTGGNDENKGIYQIDIFSPLGNGKNESIVMADLIADRFKPGRKLTYNNRLVRCITVSRRGIVRADNWNLITVEIEYLSFTDKR